MIKKFDIDIDIEDMEPLAERFKLKRDKLGRPPRYTNNNNNSSNDDHNASIDDSQHNDNNSSNDDHISL